MRRAYPIILIVFLLFMTGGLLPASDPGPAQARDVQYEASQILILDAGPIPQPSDADLDGDGEGDRGTGDDDAPGETVKVKKGSQSSGSHDLKLATWIWIRYSTWFLLP